MIVDDMLHYIWLALQLGCSQAGEAVERSCQTPLQLQASQAQPADVTLPSSTTPAMTDATPTLLTPDEAMGLSGVQDQDQAVARAEMLPALIHHSLMQCARGNKLPANTPLYGLFRTLQEGQMLMVYGTNLLDVEMVTVFHSCHVASCPFVPCCLVSQPHQAQRQTRHAGFHAC